MACDVKPKRSRKQKREDRKIALKTAAIEVFSEKGYHNAKVSEIVELVGVAQGTFYLYYEGKQQLFSALLDDFLSMVVHTVANWEPSALHTIHDLRLELTRVGLMLTEVFDTNRGLATIFFKEASVEPEFVQTVRSFYDTLAIMLTSFNRILCERGVIAPMNFRLLAFATIGQVERIISEHVIHQSFGPIAHREIVDHLVTLFLDGTRQPIHTSPPLVEEIRPKEHA